MENTLSVIIPNYNKEKYIERCVTTVVGQSYQPFEIIVVDDCSTDLSKSLICKLANQYNIVKPLFLKKNGGVSNARNKGLEIAKGEYVTFIDSDDFYYNVDKLKNEMSLLLKFEKEGKKLMTYSTTMIVDENGEMVDCKGNKTWKKKEFINGKALRELVSLLKQKRVPRDYCIKKSYLQDSGAYSYHKNFYEDLDLLMRIAKCGVEFLPTYKCGTAYRQVPNGLSRQSAEKHDVEILSICNNYISELNWTERVYVFVCQRLIILKKKIRRLF